MAENINAPVKKTDARFDEWLFNFWAKYQFTRDLANAIGILPVGNGGTGTTDTPANGELLIGNGTDYTVATLTAGSNITITNGAGSITIDASGGGAVSNKLTSDLVVDADTSYIVMSYLDTNGFSITLNGQMGIL